ncbi:hypothetical protein HDF10_003962 [Edaphobacter lichenicola]|uniref:xylose isomerase n=1 Tax=Tunturiibacter lichenicola TaxID=2051959 RepID=A0A7W8JB64_9BACT|nr:hypothetical protein [Edaphobacter lichenicola]
MCSTQHKTHVYFGVYMGQSIYGNFPTVRYEGAESTSDLAYRWYDADRTALGKPPREHLRCAVVYWHSPAMNSSDPFGAPTIRRPWMDRSDEMQAAQDKADAASICFVFLIFPSTRSMTAMSLPRTEPCGNPLPIFTACRITWRRRWSRQRHGCCGGRRTCSVIRDYVWRRNQPRPRSLCLQCDDDQALHGRHDETGWRKLRATGRTRRLRDAAEHKSKHELEQMGRMLALVVEYKHKIGLMVRYC